MSTQPAATQSANFGPVVAGTDGASTDVHLIKKNDDGSQCPFLNRKGVGPDGEAVPQFAVTVFTISGCPHCIRAKAALKELSLEWEEINLATHPSRRKDMVSLTGAHTVPQVFFDNEHVGDAARVAELLQSGELLRLALYHQHAVDKSMEADGTPLPELDVRLAPVVDFSLPTRTGSASRPASRATSARCSNDHAVCGIDVDGGGGGADCVVDGTSPGSGAGSRRQSRSLSTDNAGIDSFIYVAEKHFKYSELLRQLCEVLDIRSRRYRLVVYDHVFVGSEATTVFQSFFGLKTRSEAVAAGRALLRLGVFRHVTNDHDFKDAELFYRLQLHSEPLVLNSWRTFSTPAEETKSSDDSGSGDGDDDGSGSSAVASSQQSGESAKIHKRSSTTLLRYEGRRAHRMLERCRDEFDAILASATDEKTGMVDYLAMARADRFSHFQESVCRLQQCDVMGFDDSSKVAFFLNLYNLMVQHAFVALGVPSSPRQRMLFFDAVKYSVSGFTLSLNDIEHGILRCNAQAGYRFYRQFGRDDPRLDLCVQSVDPRIHFALNCGARSCPAVRHYTPRGLNDELHTAACGFCSVRENVAVSGTSVTLSKIFSWYYRDFGSTNDILLLSLCDWVPPATATQIRRLLRTSGGPHVSYAAYNWQPPAVRFRQFEAANFRTNRSACLIS